MCTFLKSNMIGYMYDIGTYNLLTKYPRYVLTLQVAGTCSFIDAHLHSGSTYKSRYLCRQYLGSLIRPTRSKCTYPLAYMYRCCWCQARKRIDLSARIPVTMVQHLAGSGTRMPACMYLGTPERCSLTSLVAMGPQCASTARFELRLF